MGTVDAQYVVFRAVRRKSIGGKAGSGTPREAPLCPGLASARHGLVPGADCAEVPSCEGGRLSSDFELVVFCSECSLSQSL